MVNLSSQQMPMWQTKGVTMTRKQSSRRQVRLEELMSKDQELLKSLVQEALQETLEAQMRMPGRGAARASSRPPGLP